MNFSRIKKLLKVEVFCTEMEYPSPVDKDFMVKEEAYYNSHAWRMGVVIEKEDFKHRDPEITVSFSRALTSAARKRGYNLKEYKEGADYIRIRASRGYEFVTVRPLGDKEGCMVKEVGYIAYDIDVLRHDIRSLRHDLMITALAYGDVLTEEGKSLLEKRRGDLSDVLMSLNRVASGWEEPITKRK